MSEYQISKFVLNNSLIEKFEPPIIFNNDIVVYEVVRIINKKILFLEDHLERFFDSFQCLNIPLNLTKQHILEQLNLLIKSNDISNGNVKFHLNISTQNRTQNFYAYFIPHAYPSAEQYKKGVPISIIHALRSNPNAKIQRTELKQQIESLLGKENTYEAILLTHKETVTEGSRSNLFMIKNDQIYTAKERDILPGITRKYVLQICKNLSLPINMQSVTYNEMLAMDTLFLSGTSPKVLPINSIYENKFDAQHPLLRKIMKVFDELIENYLQSNSKFCE